MLNTDYRDIEEDDPVRRNDLYRADRRILRLPLRQAAVPVAASSSTRQSIAPVFQAAPVVNYPNETAVYAVHGVQVSDRAGASEDEHRLRVSARRRAIRTIRCRGRRTRRLYQKYQALAERTPDVHFAGRLATYKYYNMDQVVAQALTLYKKLSGARRPQAVAQPA